MDKIRTTIPRLHEMKGRGEKIVMLTAYDYPMARMLDESGIDVILVGDSLAMAFQGFSKTVSVTVDEMVYHCSCVTRGASMSMVVGDMPFLAYETSPADAVRNAGRLIKEGGVDAVKLEGGIRMLPAVEALVKSGIAVMGHVVLTPQSSVMLGGFRVQGKDIDSAKAIIDDAIALEQAGAFSVVLECVPAAVASIISKRISIPTIGIGAGSGCDGQVLVINDMLGLSFGFKPKFVRKYADIALEIAKALTAFKEDVRSGAFPGGEHSFSITPEASEELKRQYNPSNSPEVGGKL